MKTSRRMAGDFERTLSVKSAGRIQAKRSSAYHRVKGKAGNFEVIPFSETLCCTAMA
jgi:hypothetical protein